MALLNLGLNTFIKKGTSELWTKISEYFLELNFDMIPADDLLLIWAS